MGLTTIMIAYDRSIAEFENLTSTVEVFTEKCFSKQPLLNKRCMFLIVVTILDDAGQ